MNCQQFREMMDSYISDELLVETNHDVLRHLENCPACRAQLAAQRSLRSRLRSAVRNSMDAQINQIFVSRLQTNLRETALHPIWREKFFGAGSLTKMRLLAAAAICLLIVAGFAGIRFKYRDSAPVNVSVAKNQTNSLPENLLPSESPITQTVQAAWREITHFAVGDHKNCALKFNLREKPITLDEAAEKYGKYNKDLDKAVLEPLREIFPGKTSGEVKLLEAHSCVFDGRRFAHIVLRRQNHTISVLVTDADLPDETAASISGQAAENLEVARFSTKHHAVFVISDMTAAENLTFAQVISPTVRRHIGRFGA